MITSKNNFKKYLRTRYPDIKAESISGVSAYLLDKPLSPQDMLDYSVMQLEDGKYVVFIGMQYNEVLDIFTEMKETGITTKTMTTKASIEMPTTFTSFQQWLQRNNKTYKHRTFIPHMSIEQCLQGTDYSNNSNVSDNTPCTWYQYELEGEIDPLLLIRVPYTVVANTDGTVSTIVLIKASSSSYKSKKQQRLENFNLMQPLYEQIVVACNEDDWERALHLAESYKEIKFQRKQRCKIEELQDAHVKNILTFYLNKPDDEVVTNDVEDDF